MTDMADRELLEYAAKAAGFLVGTVCERRGVLMLIDGWFLFGIVPIYLRVE